MATKTEAARLHDVLREEYRMEYCRENLTVLDGQTLVVGELCKLNADDKVITCGAAADEVQTITLDAAITGGVLSITYFAPNGDPIVVATAWDTDWATTMAAWNVASVAAATAWYGAASNGAVMTGTATVPILTFSGVGFTSLAIPKLAIIDTEDATGPDYGTVVQTTEGHGAAEDATMVCLEDSSPSGADGDAVMLVRGPAIVDLDQLTGPTGYATLAVAALKKVGIVARSEPTNTETLDY